MNVRLLARRLRYAAILIVLPFLVNAQLKTVTGKVTSEKDGSPISGATVLARGAKGTQTAADGNFVIQVPDATKKLTVSSVGFGSSDVTIGADNTASVVLKATGEGLTEVVVIGYGTARKKDVTGAVGSVSAKSFNKGPQSSPDQLIQGKLAGVQVLSNNGAPGAGTTIRIRGASSIRAGNTPLFVIDGVPLSNTNSRPDIGFTDVGGGAPSGNPLNFINPADIASMEVLKDASAAAIYGSRGANGVVLITTRKGQSGSAKVDFNMSVGTSSIAKKLKVLTGDQYREALSKNGYATTVSTPSVPTSNYGSNTDALGSILRTGITQNYGVAVSSGSENARYRFSLGYLNQEGIIRKTDFEKLNAAFYSSIKMLENKKLTIDFNVTTAQTIENIAPISNSAGAKGSLIGQALQWNPTRSLYRGTSPDSLNILYGSDLINPLAYSEAYFDKAKVTTVLASVSPSYKITNDLEVKTLMSVNYSSGVRKQYLTPYINVNDINIDQTLPTTSANFGKGGEVNVSQNELITKQITNTLSYNKAVNSNIYLNAVIGHEYLVTNFGGNSFYGRRLQPTSRPYYYYFNTSDPGTRQTNGFQDPTQELQSFFGRAIVNLYDRYIITGTVRADGSSKFGKNNRYGTFPSLAVAWNLGKEKFMSDVDFVSNVKVRASYGTTGNQEYPAGAAQLTYIASGNPGTFNQAQIANESLKWEQTTTANFGLDFSILKDRVSVSLDYFNRNTKNILFPREAADPVTPNVNAIAVQKNDFTLSINANVTLLKNKLENFIGEIPTGEVNGQGLSGAFAQLIKSGYPINSFYLKKFTGIDKATGISSYEGGEQKFFLGAANPKALAGLTFNIGYKKLTIEMGLNGAFGHFIYNNTANAVLGYNNLASNKNVGLNIYNQGLELGEKVVNPTSASSRYLEKGDYLKMSNLTASYNIGAIGKNIKTSNLFINAQNLFVITNFTGFDPEINVSKPLNGVPSFGMENTPYPSSRTINFGINFSL
jgi:TonB-dependent starch-binding outer membrane protein SusC